MKLTEAQRRRKCRYADFSQMPPKELRAFADALVKIGIEAERKALLKRRSPDSIRRALAEAAGGEKP